MVLSALAGRSKEERLGPLVDSWKLLGERLYFLAAGYLDLIRGGDGGGSQDRCRRAACSEAEVWDFLAAWVIRIQGFFLGPGSALSQGIEILQSQGAAKEKKALEIPLIHRSLCS